MSLAPNGPLKPHLTIDQIISMASLVVETSVARVQELNALSHPFPNATLQLVRKDIRALRTLFKYIPPEYTELLEHPLLGEDSRSLFQKLQIHIFVVVGWLEVLIESEIQPTSADDPESDTTASKVSPDQPQGQQESLSHHFTKGRWTILFAGTSLIAIYFALAEETSLTRLISSIVAWFCLSWILPTKWVQRLD